MKQQEFIKWQEGEFRFRGIPIKQENDKYLVKYIGGVKWIKLAQVIK